MRDFIPSFSSRKHSAHARSIGTWARQLTKPVFKARGFRDINILAHWSAIIGEALAAVSYPERLVHRGRAGGVLTICVEGAMAIEIQHLAPQIIERINTYFGGEVVQRIRITQTLSQDTPSPGAPAPPSQIAIDAARTHLADMDDSPLKEALLSLGARIYARD